MYPLAFGFSPTEILIVLLLATLLFGAKRIPELGRSIGAGLRNFKKGLQDDGDEEAPSTKSLPRDDTNHQDSSSQSLGDEPSSQGRG